jgi:tRNA(Ile)-lysidine synthase
LAECTFPPAGTAVAVAVSGGPDSLGLLLLAIEAGLIVTVHHVDHHARPTSGEDAAYVAALCAERGLPFVRHDVVVTAGANFEQRARAARRAALPAGALTGHTMDDLAETLLLNLLRGAGLAGLSPMVGDPSKPLLGLRRQDLHDYVDQSGLVARRDETNLDPRYRRNRVRHELLPLLDDVADRDVTPVLARLAAVAAQERQWLAELAPDDGALTLEAADCRVVRTWPPARLDRWLRRVLAETSPYGDTYAPSVADLARATAVVTGAVVACELPGGRRLARRDQRLTLE